MEESSEIEMTEMMGHTSTEENDSVSERMPTWKEHITIRGLVASLLIGFFYSVIVMKLNLTTGLVPNLNVTAAILAFLCIKLAHKAGFTTTPFTKQENTIIHTCVVACYSIAVGGGFGSYLLGLNKKTYEQAGIHTEGNSPGSFKEPGIGWMTGYLFVSSFVGLLAVVPLTKFMIIDRKLDYPSGTATAMLINDFHTSTGDEMARKQFVGFMKSFCWSFWWAFFQWFYPGSGTCLDAYFPTFVQELYKNSFYFDFSMTYIGAGMMCSHLVNLSSLAGAVLLFGIMWLIGDREGDWFPSGLPESSMKSLDGYKVFIGIALILGDGLYNVLLAAKKIYDAWNNPQNNIDRNEYTQPEDTLQLNEVFLRETIPFWIAATGYILLSIVSIIIIPIMFPELKWYYVLLAYFIAPLLGFCNAYGAGLTDKNMAYSYGKLALFFFAAMSSNNNGVVAGLVGCGLIKSIVSISSDLMHDFKTAHLTLTSPRSMLVSQAIGTAIGCVVAPLTFFLFYRKFDVGKPDGEYKAPYAIIYRNLAILGVEGLSALPRHCLKLCFGFFAFAILANMVRDYSERVGKWVPLPTAMSIPLLVGAYLAFDMCIGSLVVFVRSKLKKENANLMVPALASGLICGEGLWIFLSSFVALFGWKHPICMGFSGTKHWVL